MNTEAASSVTAIEKNLVLLQEECNNKCSVMQASWTQMRVCGQALKVSFASKSE